MCRRPRSCARSQRNWRGATSSVPNLYIRPLAYKSAERIGVAMDDQDAFAIVACASASICTARTGCMPASARGGASTTMPFRPRGKICGAYANSALASDDARRSGFDEAIFLNENGHVAEGATCNLFMLRKGRFDDAARSENVLEGITRQCVEELAQHELALEVVERPIDRSELYVCDELFLTGTAVGLAPVTRVDHRPVGDGKIGAVTQRLRQLYFDAVRGRLPQYRKWLLPVYGAAERRPERGADRHRAD